jgi:hypothetical protein
VTVTHVISIDSRASTNPPRKTEERRLDRGSWAMLALACTILFYSLGLALYAARLPTDGWAFQFDPTQPNAEYSFTEYYGNTPSPLQRGDVLVAIAGQPIERIVAETLALRSPRPASWQASNRVAYTVHRGGRNLSEQGYSTDDTRLLNNLTTQAAPLFVS